MTRSGRALDGYLDNCVVYADVNGNGGLSTAQGEPFNTSNFQNGWTLTLSDVAAVSAPLRVVPAPPSKSILISLDLVPTGAQQSSSPGVCSAPVAGLPCALPTCNLAVPINAPPPPPRLLIRHRLPPPPLVAGTYAQSRIAVSPQDDCHDATSLLKLYLPLAAPSAACAVISPLSTLLLAMQERGYGQAEAKIKVRGRRGSAERGGAGCSGALGKGGKGGKGRRRGLGPETGARGRGDVQGKAVADRGDVPAVLPLLRALTPEQRQCLSLA